MTPGARYSTRPFLNPKFVRMNKRRKREEREGGREVSARAHAGYRVAARRGAHLAPSRHAMAT